MRIDLPALVGAEHGKALALREALARELTAAAPAGLRERTCCLTLLAGAGTRWVRSLALAKERFGTKPGDEYGRLIEGFPSDAPRGLFPVRNFITAGPERIPMAAYALDALRGLGSHVLVVRGWEREIREGIVEALGIDGDTVAFCMQKEGLPGKVLGHGDAARQAMERWRESSYVIANFGGDANSPLTATAGLQALALLEGTGAEADLILPVARMPHPAYPVTVDGRGLPLSFGHNKLGGSGTQGEAGMPAPGSFSYVNVGIRVYRTEALLSAMDEIGKRYWREGEGYSIPGNDPDAHEFALDNIDALLASRGRARILAISNPEELTPAKSFDEIPGFEAAARKVRAEWTSFGSAFQPE